MRILSFLIYLITVLFSNQLSQSPHGPDFKVSCSTCHSSKGWHLDKAIYSFDHNKTKMPLVGQHNVVDCRKCHVTLIFSAAKNECSQCHTDVHQSTVGLECSRCHTPASWLVNNITEIHRASRFPLLGAHRTADCFQCHKSESLARFDVIGINCIDCHRENYMATTTPSHTEAGFSQDCSICHPVNSFQWAGAGFNHSMFPLTLGHSIPKCIDCHIGGSYTSAPTDCFSCHTTDYNNTSNPNHQTLGFSHTCSLCHTTNQGWKPASYTQHDSQSFPVYSGRHKGTWTSCTECHTNPSSYAQFTCISCHEHSNKAGVDNQHDGVNGYSYNATSCFQCHPRGNAGK